MNNNIYLILFDRSTTDSDGIETFLYRDYDAAVKKFNELIDDECDADTSWVGSEVFDAGIFEDGYYRYKRGDYFEKFDENGEVNDGYELDCNTDDETAEELYWHVVDKSDYNRRSFINLMKREIQ